MFRLFILLALGACTLAPARATDAQADTVVARYRAFAIRTLPRDDTDSLLTRMDASGRWRGLDYADREPANWKIARHLYNLRTLCLAWADPASPQYEDPVLLERILTALDHWLENRYTSGNWWHNQIGVPTYMRDIIVLMGHELGPERLRGALEVMGQLRVLRPGQGANLIWSADLGFHYGALTGDLALMSRCSQLLIDEVRILPGGEGIQPDWSFQQHGARLQMYQYGGAYFLTSVRVAWETMGTRWEYPVEKLEILSDFALEGWQWMARGVNTVPGTVDRSVSRLGVLRSADLREVIPCLRGIDPSRRDRYDALEAMQNGRGSLAGLRAFPCSDFSAYHTPEYSFFLKTLSTRTLPTEAINNENLKGSLLGSGDGYFVRTGNEYYDMMPVWDWTRLPGITTFAGADSLVRRPSPGSLGCGDSGMMAMDYVLRDSAKADTLTARKLWVCHQGWVVCAVAGVRAPSMQAETVLDQSRLRGEVRTDRGRVSHHGITALRKVRWLEHDSLRWVFPEPVALRLKTGRVSGDWHSINWSESPATVTDSVFLPSVLHSAAPGQGFCYGVCHAGVFPVAPIPWRMARNDARCQAVAFPDGTYFVAFYEAGTFMDGDFTLPADRPCLVIVRGGRVFIRGKDAKWD
jgi:chondroitin AC lyase